MLRRALEQLDHEPLGLGFGARRKGGAGAADLRRRPRLGPRRRPIERRSSARRVSPLPQGQGEVGSTGLGSVMIRSDGGAAPTGQRPVARPEGAAGRRGAQPRRRY